MKKKMRLLKKYSDLCTGCGLCESVNNVKLIKDDKGFLRPAVDKSNLDNVEFLDQICPASGKQCKDFSGDIWGNYKSVYLGHSSDPQIRYKASSGGAISAILLYLRDRNLVDGIIHVRENKEKPIESLATCSITKHEIIENSGSRYCSTATLSQVSDYLKDSKKYALVGKPCDITAIRNYLEINKELEGKFPYLISFFCAGAPSENANNKLLETIGCSKDDCANLKYRGNGWPGYATAIDKSGNLHRTSYQEAWSKILGRDIRLICRFCLDGIGESADISCCDAWYYDEEAKRPIFSEREGRNLIFARNQIGKNIIEAAIAAGYIELSEEVFAMSKLKHIQGYQYHRRATMRFGLLGMKIGMRSIPKYNINLLKLYEKNINLRSKLGVLKGTLIRIGKGKI